MVDVEQHMDLEDDIPHSPASRLRGGEGQSSCIREYEVFPGRNSICCSGRLITGPSQSVFIFNLCLIFGATTLFYVFIASRIHMSLVVIGSILQAITLYFLFLAAFTEPGIVKRGAPTAIEAKEPPMVTVGKDRVKLRWCKTCRIYRPPRCKHCRFCDNCVEEFDHHCPWVMNCVGKRNYRYFVAFVASVAALAVFVFVCTLAFLIIGATKGGVTPVGTMVSIALLLLTGCLGCTLSSFAAFHCKLIAQGITTNEYIKGRVGSAEPRQQKGCVANCSEIYCQALPQSNIRLRGFLDEKGESGGSLQDSELGRVEADAKNETS